MIQLVYTSIAIKVFEPIDLRLLLVKARIANASLEVTGMLLFHKGSFLQVLEGSEQSVDRVFGWIQSDPRHEKIKLLSREGVLKREFETWSMGFMDTSGWPLGKGMIGYNSIPEFVGADTNAKRYLRLFHLGLFSSAKGDLTVRIPHVKAEPVLGRDGLREAPDPVDRGRK